MNKETATLTLTEKLQQIGHVNIVTDSAIKSHVLENAKSKVLDITEQGLTPLAFNWIDINPVGFGVIYDLKQKYPQANYFFTEGKKASSDSGLENALITPVSIIGQTEERILKRKCYKDVPYKIRRALEILEIPNFIKAYEIYLSLESGDIALEKFTCPAGESMIYKPFKSGDIVEIGDVIQGTESKKYYIVESINSNGITGQRYTDAKLKILDGNNAGCDSKFITPIYKYGLKEFSEFQEFVFSLPSEEQNIIANQQILKTIKNKDTITDILYNEYCHGEQFQKYFDVLDENYQKHAFNTIKTIPKRNLPHDSFLWNKGFKEVTLDYLQLYKENADEFITYFKSKNPKEKKTIINDLLECDYTNNQVATWMDENEIELIRKVSMDG